MEIHRIVKTRIEVISKSINSQALYAYSIGMGKDMGIQYQWGTTL